MSPFCMLKKCRNPSAALVPEDRCPIPNACGCSCHEDDDDERDAEDQLADPMEHVKEMAASSREAAPERRTPTRDERAEQRVPCERADCDQQLRPGPGVASHMRWYARADEAAELAERARSGAPAVTVPETPEEPPVEVEPEVERDLTPVVYEEPSVEPDVSLWFDEHERALLQVLVDASDTFEDVGDVVNGMLALMIESAREDLTHSGAMEALRYIGGLSEEKQAAMDALDAARR